MASPAAPVRHLISRPLFDPFIVWHQGLTLPDTEPVSFQDRLSEGDATPGSVGQDGWGLWHDKEQKIGQILPAKQVEAMREAQRAAEEEADRIRIAEEDAHAAALAAGRRAEEAAAAAAAAKAAELEKGDGASSRFAMLTWLQNQSSRGADEEDEEGNEGDGAPSLLDTWQDDCSKIAQNAIHPCVATASICTDRCEQLPSQIDLLCERCTAGRTTRVPLPYMSIYGNI